MPVPLRPADLASRKLAGLPITVLTAWDALSGALVAEAGADAVLVGEALMRQEDVTAALDTLIGG